MVSSILEINQVNELLENGWLPDNYRNDLDSLYVFGGYEGETLVAAGVFADGKRSLYELELRHIYVDPPYRGKGYARELLMLCIKDVESIGIDELSFSGFVSKQELTCIKALLESAGLVPLCKDRTAMLYERGHFIGRKASMLHDNIDKLDMSIEIIPDYNDERLQEFWKKSSESEIYISENEYIPEACVFGMINNKIEAALCMKMVDDVSIETEGFYHSDKVKIKSQLLPFLMSKMIIENVELKDSVKNVYVVCKYESIAKALVENFGEGKEELHKLKYFMRM